MIPVMAFILNNCHIMWPYGILLDSLSKRHYTVLVTQTNTHTVCGVHQWLVRQIWYLFTGSKLSYRLFKSYISPHG